MLATQTPPNFHTFPSLIKAATHSFPSLGTSLHTHVVKRGVLYDPFVQTSLVAFYSQIGQFYDAHRMFDEITHPGIVEFNALLDACAKNDQMGSAFSLFRRMPMRDVVSWTCVINGFSRNGLNIEAISFFRRMIVHEDVKLGLVKPNEATYVSLLSSCASLDEDGALYLGKQVHGYIIKNEAVSTVFMGTALVDFYGKVGCLDTAIKIFNNMVVKRTCSWNAMISSLASNGREKEALDLFEIMKSEGSRPNDVTFVALLTACARGKFVELGMKLFRLMRSEYGEEPIAEHYGCVIDLLGRAGLLREGSEIIKSMPFEADASVLGAFLGACKIHGAIEFGDELGRRLLQLQPLHCGRFVLLANINAGVKKWRVAADLRKAMADSGIRKIPAFSLISSKFCRNI